MSDWVIIALFWAVLIEVCRQNLNRGSKFYFEWNLGNQKPTNAKEILLLVVSAPLWLGIKILGIALIVQSHLARDLAFVLIFAPWMIGLRLGDISGSWEGRNALKPD
jgi:hypothetical protein